MKRRYLVAFVCFGTLGFTALANASAVQWSDNGHWYERVEGSVSWQAASEAAIAKGGYLVSITSAAENAFLTINPYLGNTGVNDSLHYFWTGGYQPEGAAEPGGGWAWANGDAFTYSNWYVNEPNNAGEENRLIFDHGFSVGGKTWNDVNADTIAAGYVVEYDTKPASAVPVPSAVLLLAAGFAGLTGIARKNRL